MTHLPNPPKYGRMQIEALIGLLITMVFLVASFWAIGYTIWMIAAHLGASQ